MDFDELIIEIFNYSFKRCFENQADYTINTNGYVYVDGEEGDYGVVTYYRGEELVATRYIFGGDYTETILTNLGKQFVADLFKKRIDEWSKE